METYFHCMCKNMLGTDKHKMKDDIYFSQEGKTWNWEGALKSFVIFYFSENKQKSDAHGAHTCMHAQAVWKVFTILTQELKFFSDYTVQCAGGRFFKENSWKTVSLRQSVTDFCK